MPAVLVVTTEGVPGYQVTSVIGQVVGSIARLSNAFTEGIRTMDGQLNPRRSQDLAQWRRDAVNEMIEDARRQGANAIIGMRFDNRGISTAWAEICAYGTAVRVDPEERPAPVQPPPADTPSAPPQKPPVGAAPPSAAAGARAAVEAPPDTEDWEAPPEAEDREAEVREDGVREDGVREEEVREDGVREAAEREAAEATPSQEGATEYEARHGTGVKPAPRSRPDTGERVGPELITEPEPEIRPSSVGWPEADEPDGPPSDTADKPDPDWPDTPTDPSLRAPD
jgi:uncharacterized protein YbjQ (UPF0145 family)